MLLLDASRVIDKFLTLHVFIVEYQRLKNIEICSRFDQIEQKRKDKVVTRAKVVQERAAATGDYILTHELGGLNPGEKPLDGFPSVPDNISDWSDADKQKEAYHQTAVILKFYKQSAMDEENGQQPNGYGGKFEMADVETEVGRLVANMEILARFSNIPEPDTSGINPSSCTDESERVNRDYKLNRDTVTYLNFVIQVHEDLA